MSSQTPTALEVFFQIAPFNNGTQVGSDGNPLVSRKIVDFQGAAVDDPNFVYAGQRVGRTLVAGGGGGGGIGHGTADQAYLTNHAGTGAAWTSVTQDLGLNAGAATVKGIQAQPVPAPSGTGTTLTWNSGGSGLFAWIAAAGIGIGLASQIYQTNAAGSAAGWSTLTGDVAYTGAVGTVQGIQTKPVPAPSGTATALLWNVSGSGLFSWGSPNVGIGTADQFYVTNHAGTLGIWQTVGGDVSYASGSVTVSGILTKAVPALSGTATVLTWNAGGSGAFSWGSVASIGFGSADQVYLTNHAGAAAAWTTLTQDVTINAGAASVVGIQTHAVPTPSGTGTSLLWNVGSSGVFSWGSPGSGVLTGVDVIGADSAHEYVVSISGSGGAGGTVPLHISGLQFDSTQAAPILSQAAQPANVTAPQNLTIGPQGPFASATTVARQTPGSLLVSVAAPIGSGVRAGLLIQETSSTGLFRFAGYTGTSGQAIWLGAAAIAPTGTNFSLYQDATNGISIIDPVSCGLFGGGSLGANQAALVCDVNGTHIFSQRAVGTALEINDTLIYARPGGASGGRQFETGRFSGRHYTALNQCGTGVLSSDFPTGDGVTLIYNRQVEPTSAPVNCAELYANAGNLWVYQSNGTKFQIAPGGGLVTGVDAVALADNAHVYIQSISGASGAGGDVVVAANTRFRISTAAGVSFLNDGGTPCIFNDSSGDLSYSSPTNVTAMFCNGASNRVADFSAGSAGGMALYPNGNNQLLIKSNGTIATAGADVFVIPQMSTGAASGNAIFSLSAPGAGTTEAALIVRRAGQEVFRSSGLPGAVTSGTIWLGLGASAATATNFVMTQDSGGSLEINDGASGAILFDFSGTEKVAFDNVASRASFDLPLGGLTQAIGLASTTTAIGNGTFDWTAATGNGAANSPYITVTGTVSTSATIIIPDATPAGVPFWLIDMRAVVVTGTLTIKTPTGPSGHSFANGGINLVSIAGTPAGTVQYTQLN